MDFDLIWLLSQVHALLSQGMQQALEHSPISSDGLWFLATVMMLEDEATPGQLAQWMVRKPNSISSMTQRLEEKGFVEKRTVVGPNNRNYLRIVLTDNGQKFLQKQWGTPLVSTAFSGLGKDDKQHLRRLLLKVRAAATQKAAGYTEPPFPSTGRPSQYWKQLKGGQRR